jgi:hypothetical protein
MLACGFMHAQRSALILRSDCQPMTTLISRGGGSSLRAEEVEAASVGRDVVLSSPVPEADRRNLELDRQSESRRPIGCPAHRRTAEPPVRVDEEKLGAVAAPDWLITAITGDNTACGWTGDAAHRHLWSS